MDNSPRNPVKEKLARDEPVLGMLVTMPSVHMAQLLSAAGLDWLMIDMEHGPIDLSSTHAMIAATQGTACAPMVRVPLGNLELAKPVLDSGAFGIVFPMVCTGDEAREVTGWMNYPPQGKRGVGPIYAAPRWGVPMADYLATANETLATFILIEHIEAVRNLDEILAVEGIDAACIAPFDLSASMGVPGQYDRPEVKKAIAEAEEKILASDKALGGLSLSAGDARAKLDAGYRVLILGYDAHMVNTYVSGLLKDIRG